MGNLTSQIPIRYSTMVLVIIVGCLGYWLLGGVADDPELWNDAVKAGAGRPTPGKDLAHRDEPRQRLAPPEQESGSDLTRTIAARIRIRLVSTTHDATSVTVVDGVQNKAAMHVGPREWVVARADCDRPGAMVRVEFGPAVRIILHDLRRPSIDVEVPALGDLSVRCWDPAPADRGWMLSLTPETAEGLRRAFIAQDLSIQGAKGRLEIWNCNLQATGGQVSQVVAAPVGSTWTVSIGAHGRQFEKRHQSNVTVPAALEFRAEEPDECIMVIGRLPQGTQLALYERRDQGCPLVVQRIDEPNSESTRLFAGRKRFPKDAQHDLRCVLPDGRHASFPLSTDASGNARVILDGAQYHDPVVINVDPQHAVAHLYFFARGKWRELQPELADASYTVGHRLPRRAGSSSLCVIWAGSAWNRGLLVTARGRVASLSPSFTGSVSPVWIPGKPATVRTEQFQRLCQNLAWHLSIAAETGASDSIWLSVHRGRGSPAALGKAPFFFMPSRRMKLWVKCLDGPGKGQQTETIQPFR